MDGSAATTDNLANVIGEIHWSGENLSNHIQTEIQSGQLLAPPPVANGSNWATFGGVVGVVGTTLTTTVPCSEVHTNIAGWIAATIAALTGVMAGFLAAALCVATAGRASSVCAFVQGFTTAFVWTMVSELLNGGTLYSGETWATAIAGGLVGGLGTAGWFKWGAAWVAEHMRPMLIAVGNAVSGTLNSLGFWLGNAATTAAAYVKTTATTTAGWIAQKCVEAAEKLGARTAASNIRLMPLGDSITAGFQSTSLNGYRLELYTDLVNEGHTVLNFVGSQSNGTMADPANEGHAGYTISQLEHPSIGTDDLATYRPNIVTLMIGTNDMDQDHLPATAPDRLESLINQVLAAAPDATVVVASLIPSTLNPATEARIQTYNAAVSGVVDTLAAAGKHVLYVNMDDVTTADLNGDGVHPNDAGYKIIGDVFNDGVEEAIGAGWISAPVQNAATCAGGTGDQSGQVWAH